MKEKTIKIIRILSKYEVMINAGFRENIEEGDLLKILDSEPSQIIDPDTLEILGELEAYKFPLIVKQVFPKFSICKTRNVSTGTSAFIAMASINNSLSGIRREELLIDEEDIENIFDEYSYNKVNIGDVVVKLD